MSEDVKKKSKPVGVELEQRGFWRGVIVLFVAVFAISSLAFGCYVLKLHLFADNRHFTLRRFLVESTARDSSRWSGSGAAEELAGVMGVAVNESNIFAQELADLRARALISCPGIERLTVERVLPDTLKVRIVERMPQATIWFIGSDARRIELAVNVERSNNNQPAVGILLADANSVIMGRRDCATVDPALLPQITFQAENVVAGATVQVKPGETLGAIQGAMEILNEVKKRSSNLEIKSITLEVRDEKLEPSQVRRYIVRFNYNGHTGTAVIPLGNVAERLNVLEFAIQQSIAEGRPSNVYNLMFENQVIQK